MSGELGAYDIVVGNEGDRNDLDLWWKGGSLVEAVAAVCNNTIVVVHSTGPVYMPWSSHPNITGIIYAGAPGEQTGPSIVDVLYGNYNPSGRLPFSISNSESDYGTTIVYNSLGFPEIDYTEKLLLDYRYMDSRGIVPMFEFGFGLSYTTFAYSGMLISAAGTSQVVTFTVTNTGAFAGAEKPQLYLAYPPSAGEPSRVLRGFDEVELAVGASSLVTITLGQRDMRSQHIPNKRIPILVCSAQSYTSKAEGTTQCLLDAIDAAVHPPALAADTLLIEDTKKTERVAYDGPFTPPPTPPQAKSPTRSTHVLPKLTTYPPPSTIINGIFERHCAGARRLLLQDTCKDKFAAAGSILSRLEKDLRDDCDHAIRLLSAVQTLGEISNHTRDRIVSVGELMSCRTVVAALQSRHISAHLVDLTDLNVPAAQVTDRISLDSFVTAIRHKLISSSYPIANESKPVLVATGFFGPVPESLLDFIGRGYTDVCAALCARAVEAEELQIWKEVDGVFSADPRKISTARLLHEITSVQAKLLTAYGSEVIHHRAIDQAIRAGIPIYVKNVVNPAGAGTRVETCTAVADRHVNVQAPSTCPSAPAPLVFAVTILNDLTLVDVRFETWELLASSHPLSIVLDIVKQDKHSNIAMDIISTSQEEVSFVVPNSGSQEDKTSRSLQELKRVASVTISPQMSYVQVVFDHKDQSSILAAIMKTLAYGQIEVQKISHRHRGDGVGFIVQTSVALQVGEMVHDALLDLSLRQAL
ncbi:hypothetical protein C0991_003271 [Blastosporella zonata]|nr:hypothetical protein C0991_003271 [Blastosporella zonata]